MRKLYAVAAMALTLPGTAWADEDLVCGPHESANVGGWSLRSCALAPEYTINPTTSFRSVDGVTILIIKFAATPLGVDVQNEIPPKFAMVDGDGKDLMADYIRVPTPPGLPAVSREVSPLLLYTPVGGAKADWVALVAVKKEAPVIRIQLPGDSQWITIRQGRP